MPYGYASSSSCEVQACQSLPQDIVIIRGRSIAARMSRRLTFAEVVSFGEATILAETENGPEVGIGDYVYMQASKSSKVGLITPSGLIFQEVLANGLRPKMSLIQALSKANRQNGIHCQGKIVSRGKKDDHYVVVLSIGIPIRFWSSPHLWKKGPANALLFSTLEAVRQSGDDDSSDKAIAEEMLESERPQEQEDSETGTTIADLPIPVLHKLFKILGQESVIELGKTCAFMRTLVAETVPNLSLTLYPHQRVAVKWMLDREEVKVSVPDPCWRRFVAEGGREFWGCTVTGNFRPDRPPAIPDSKGGFFCDEPGLGKTITGLALILRTRNLLPEPPPGAKAHLISTSRGNRIGYYLLPKTQMPGRASLGSQRKSSQAGMTQDTQTRGRRGVQQNGLEGKNSQSHHSVPEQVSDGSTDDEDFPPDPSVDHVQSAPIDTAAAAGVKHTPVEPLVRVNAAESPSSFQTKAEHQSAVSGEIKAAWPGQPQPLPAALKKEGSCNGTKESLPSLPALLRALSSETDLYLAHSRGGQGTDLSLGSGSASEGQAIGLESRYLPQPDPASQTAAAPASLANVPKTVSFDGTAVAPSEPTPFLEPTQPSGATGGVRFQETTPSNEDTGFPPDISLEASRGRVEGFTSDAQLASDTSKADPDVFIFSGEPPNFKEYSKSAAVQQNKRKAPASEDDLDPSWEVKGKRSKKTKFSAKELAEEASFVQCEVCGKWRLLPIGTQVKEDAIWVCQMHPDPAKADCKVKEEKTKTHDRHLARALGFVPEFQSLGEAENRQYFNEVLAKYPELVEERHSVIWWLAKQSPQAIRNGIQIPKMHMEATPDTFVHLLAEAGFVPQAGRTPTGKRKDSGTPITPRSSIKRLTAFHTASSKFSAWKQPHTLSKLLFDTDALLEVLENGVEEAEEKVFLSAATLLVVPANLVQHWVSQVQSHVRFNTLRILVISSDKDRSNKMPPPQCLAWNYDLVITTMPQLSSAWAVRSRAKLSPFMQVHWLRIIVDEGHMLGNSLAMTNKLQMACALRADRRWLMTGTPTPGGPNSDLAHLQPLLAFLHSKPYGSEASTWQEAVQKPFEARQPAGKRRLMDLLSRTMIRAAKKDLRMIPPLMYQVTILEFSPKHAISYNLLADVVSRNLLTSDWYDPDHEECMLNTNRNSKWAREMMNNIKKSCCVAGNCDIVAKPEDIKESLELLLGRHSGPSMLPDGPPWLLPGHKFAVLEAGMSLTMNSKGVECQKEGCRSLTWVPIITPCAHLLCTACTAKNKSQCALCGQAYLMQSVEDPARREVNPNPKWEVPIELIEWQCSYTQRGAQGMSGGMWSNDWEKTESTKCVHLLKRLYEIGAAVKEPVAIPWLGLDVGSKAAVAFKRTKVIVFSQFWEHVNLVRSHLENHKIRFAVLRAGLPASEKIEALMEFQDDPLCAVLLMDHTGAVGLDLSFVSYVFLMEPLEDMSLYKQIVSRAHRLGAKAPVHVEILAIKNTAEEELLKLTGQLRSGDKSLIAPSPSEVFHSAEKDQARAMENWRRNHMLKSMARIPEASLPNFKKFRV